MRKTLVAHQPSPRLQSSTQTDDILICTFTRPHAWMQTSVSLGTHSLQILQVCRPSSYNIVVLTKYLVKGVSEAPRSPNGYVIAPIAAKAVRIALSNRVFKRNRLRPHLLGCMHILLHTRTMCRTRLLGQGRPQ